MDLTNFNAEQARGLITHEDDCRLKELLKLIYDEALRGEPCCYTFDNLSSYVWNDLESRGFTVKYNQKSAIDSSVYKYLISW